MCIFKSRVLTDCSRFSEDGINLELSSVTVSYDDLICYLWAEAKSIGILHLVGKLIPTAFLSSLSAFAPPQTHPAIYLAIKKVGVT